MFNPDLKKMLKNCNSRYSLVIGVAKRAREMLKGCNSRYSLVVGTAKRAREIRDEAISREEHIDVKTVSTAIEEVNNGKYVIEEPSELK